MDAYSMYHLLKRLWSENISTSSGIIDKKLDNIRICVWTPEGYREVVSATYNKNLKFIELELDQE